MRLTPAEPRPQPCRQVISLKSEKTTKKRLTLHLSLTTLAVDLEMGETGARSFSYTRKQALCRDSR